MKFVPNRNLDNELKASAAYRAELELAAKPAEAAAKSFAPVRTGAYRDSIGIESAPEGVRLKASDWKAWWIEMGTSKMPPQAPLRRAVRSVGLKFRARQ